MVNTALAYELKANRPPDDLRTMAVLKCKSCDATGKIPVISFGNNPHLIEQAFLRAGWECDVHKEAKNFCPSCTTKRSKKKEKENVTMPTRLVGSPSGIRILGSLSPREVNESLKSVKDLTAVHRFDLRNILDASFDDAKGAYIDTMTDHLISEKLGIPRAVVVEFREMAYGPLKEDPLITALRMDIDRVMTNISGLQSVAARLTERLDEITKKNGL